MDSQDRSAESLQSPALVVTASPEMTLRDLAHIDDALAHSTDSDASIPDAPLSSVPPAVFGAGGPMSVAFTSILEGC